MNLIGTAIGFGPVFLLAHGTLGAQAPGSRAPRAADAKPAEISVVVTAAIRAPLEAVRAEAEKAVGRALLIEYGSARGNLKEKILKGQAFDVALLLPDVNEELAKAGKIMPGFPRSPGWMWPSGCVAT